MAKGRSSRSSDDIKFSVRLASGESLDLHANPKDTIRSIHEKIYHATGIPLSQQRLAYRGKQLQWDNTVFLSNITNNSTLRLVAQTQNSRHPLIEDLLYEIRAMCEGRKLTCNESTLTPFLNIVPKIVKHTSRALFYPENWFLSNGVPEALVMLYISPHDGNKERARNYIQDIFTSSKDKLDRPFYHQVCAPIVLRFFKLLRRYVAHNDPLHIHCRSTLESMLDYPDDASLIGFQDIFPIFSGLVIKLLHSLDSSVELSTGPSSTDVHEFNIFLRFMMNKIIHPNHPCYNSLVRYLYNLYLDLLTTLKECLTIITDNIKVTRKVERDGRWDQYLPILRLLHYISRRYRGEKENFQTNLRPHRIALCYLLFRYAKMDDDDDYKWIPNHMDLTSFETRRDLVMMLLPEVTQDYRNKHKMLINRSDLLAESFESIIGADGDSLRGPISIQFKYEEASGSGVLREWFMFVCQAIFNPHNELFIACPTDQRRFFPNPASQINPGNLEYYKFAGRIIALALMHKMQVGIAFARAFCLQLAGSEVSLEDIKDVDSHLYKSCKQILEMDPYVVDQDVLGLTFVWEFEEMGVKKVVELCEKGKEKSVNSENRKEYVNLIIKHQFVTSIAKQLSHFRKGFAEIVGNQEKMKLCFEILELEYLDQMLRGSESDISVDDWEAHTQYKGYKENDPQICWFWKIVREMSVEQRQTLLFFWTSVKYLPVEGFRGLASKLYIIKSNKKYDRLPHSYTCFNEICIPAYPSMAVMQERLNIITQEYVGFSFGAD